MAVGDIDVAAAAAALEAAGGLPEVIPTTGTGYNRDGHGRFASKPEAEAVSPEPAVTPESAPAPEAPAPAVEETPDFSGITDEAILAGEVTPQQLLAFKKSLHGDYTRKTQEAAPWRKLGNELGLENPEDFRAAAELYTQLQDPSNWPRFQSEITQYMQSYGMSPQQAQIEAANRVAEMAPADDWQTEFEGDGGSGNAQIMQMLQAQQAQIAQLTQGITQREQQAEVMRRQQAIAESLTRQEAAIQDARKSQGLPEYGEAALETIYSHLGQDGDLMAAESKFQSVLAQELAHYIQAKSSAQEVTPAPVAGGNVQATEPPKPMSWEEAHKAAMAHVEQLERSGAA